MQNLPPRIIGQYQGKPTGLSIMVFGGMHGNETAGIRALERVLHLLDIEPSHNPSFQYQGHFLAVRGNRQACAAGVRYLERDLNRQFTTEQIARVQTTPTSALVAEDRELYELVDFVQQYVTEHRPTRLIVLDLHTTTADGGIFSIATDEPESVALAKAMHAPVIKGMLSGIQGTTLHYFSNVNFDCPTVAVTFEAGQHDDPKSVDRAVAAIINLLRSVEAVRPEDVGHEHDEILQRYSEGLPAVARLRGVHRVRPQDNFQMEAGFQNFQAIPSGTLLAHDRNGPILSPYDTNILMPLYQQQGEDGFFLIEVVEP